MEKLPGGSLALGPWETDPHPEEAAAHRGLDPALPHMRR